MRKHVTEMKTTSFHVLCGKLVSKRTKAKQDILKMETFCCREAQGEENQMSVRDKFLKLNFWKRKKWLSSYNQMVGTTQPRVFLLNLLKQSQQPAVISFHLHDKLKAQCCLGFS